MSKYLHLAAFDTPAAFVTAHNAGDTPLPFCVKIRSRSTPQVPSVVYSKPMGDPHPSRISQKTILGEWVLGFSEL